MKKSILILAVVLFAAPALAATSLGSYAVTTNTDIDLVTEQISTQTNMKSCSKLTICNVTTGASATIVKVQQLSTSPGSCATCGGVNTTGWPLYPLASSGETCVTIDATKSITTGKATPIDATQFYAVTMNSVGNSSVAMNCGK